MRNLIMGAMWDCGMDGARTFLASLLRSGYRGDVVIMVDGVDSTTIRDIRALGVKVMPVTPFDRRVISGNGLRYKFYFSYLDAHPGYYDKVMLTDLRDVVIQQNPFDFSFDDELLLFLERKKIGECPWNSGWVEAIYGRGALDALRDNPISCSGVTIGSYARVYDYLILMLRQLEATSVKLGGIDQGVHNYLLYNNSLPSARTFATGAGPVMTMGYMGADYKMDTIRNLVLNDDGSIPHVVHQYDRPGLGPLMQEVYRLP